MLFRIFFAEREFILRLCFQINKIRVETEFRKLRLIVNSQLPYLKASFLSECILLINSSYLNKLICNLLLISVN